MSEFSPAGFRIQFFKDPVSAATHFGGMLLAFVGTVVLVVAAAPDGWLRTAGMGIYGVSLVGLLGASSLYHFLDLGERGNTWLRKLDHAGIYILIGGSYVPPVLHLLEGSWRIGMLTTVGVVSVVGVVCKLLWSDWLEWLSVGLYMGFAYLSLLLLPQALPLMEWAAVAWAMGGGVAYTVGAAIYYWEWPNPWPRVFGHHELWHVLVLVGAACHYGFVWTLLDIPLRPF